VEAHLRRRTYNATLSLPSSSSSSSSSSSMAAACNSPPPDYRANVGICLVNDKNEVILFLLLMMMNFFSVCVREGKSWFQTVLFPEISTVISYLFFQVLYTDLEISVYTPKYFQVGVLVFVIQIKGVSRSDWHVCFGHLR
jgi:hypothetical protein